MLKAIKVTSIIIAVLLLLPLLVGCKAEYRLNVTVGSGQGTVTPSSGTYADGTLVTISAIPDSGWEFERWEGDISGDGNPAIIRMDSDKTIEAYFVEIQSVSPIPTPTSEPTSTPTPIVTATPNTSATPTATPVPTPSPTPTPTPLPSPTPTPIPTRTDTPTPTPIPTEIPTPTPTTIALTSIPQLEWERTFSNGSRIGYCIEQTSDGGFIIVGSDLGQEELWLMKTDGNGSELWERTFNGSGLAEGYCVQQTEDGGFIILGQTATPNHSSSYIWLIKTDSSGIEQWNQKFNWGIYYADSSAIRQTSDGGYVIVGRIRSGGDYVALLIKTDESGNILWDKELTGPYSEAYSIQVTSDGGYIIAGEATSGNLCAWLSKTDASGNEQWHQTYCDVGVTVYATAVLQTPTGDYVMVGFIRERGYIVLIKADSEGNELWRRHFGCFIYNSASSVTSTTDGKYVLSGMDRGQLYLVETDSNGNTIWEQWFDYSGGVMVQTSDGGYIVLGWITIVVNNNTVYNTLLIKLK